jgi:hypothetical protein
VRFASSIVLASSRRSHECDLRHHDQIILHIEWQKSGKKNEELRMMNLDE